MSALTQDERTKVAESFWREYFALYPEPGGNDEINILRAEYTGKRFAHRSALTVLPSQPAPERPVNGWERRGRSSN